MLDFVRERRIASHIEDVFGANGNLCCYPRIPGFEFLNLSVELELRASTLLPGHRQVPGFAAHVVRQLCGPMKPRIELVCVRFARIISEYGSSSKVDTGLRYEDTPGTRWANAGRVYAY